MMDVAVIGGHGFIGNALSTFLSDAGHACTRIGRQDPLPAGPVDVLLDCNGEGRRFWANENPEENYVRSVASVEARLSAVSCDAYVYLSTVDVYGEGRGAPELSHEDVELDLEAIDTYGRHKVLAEKMVFDHAARPLVIRCATLIGPGLRKNPVFDLLNDQPLRMTEESTLSLLHTSTLGRAIEALLTAGESGIFNVAASAPIDIPALKKMIAGKRGIDPAAFPEHDEKITTRYDVNVEKISALLGMPTSEDALGMFLARDTSSA